MACMPADDRDDAPRVAVVNTAFAFTVWNHTLRTLTAVESSVMNNTMLIQVAVLAWLILDEKNFTHVHFSFLFS